MTTWKDRIEELKQFSIPYTHQDRQAAIQAWEVNPIRLVIKQAYDLSQVYKVIQRARREELLRLQLLKPLKPKIDRKLHTTHLLKTPEWQAIRVKVFARDGRTCKRCKTTEHLQIDHILPKSKYPFLTFDLNNLQVLCRSCNFRKLRKEDRFL